MSNYRSIHVGMVYNRVELHAQPYEIDTENCIMGLDLRGLTLGTILVVSIDRCLSLRDSSVPTLLNASLPQA